MLAVGGVAVSPSCTPAPNNAPIDGTVAQVIAEQSLLGGLAGGGATTSGFSYSAAQGIAKPDGRPIKTDTTLFRWASPSKTLVGVVAAMLATEGLLDLDADIATIFSGYTLPGSYLVCPDGLAAAARHGARAAESPVRQQSRPESEAIHLPWLGMAVGKRVSSALTTRTTLAQPFHSPHCARAQLQLHASHTGATAARSGLPGRRASTDGRPSRRSCITLKAHLSRFSSRTAA